MKEIKPVILSKIIVVSGERWDRRAPSAGELVKKCMSIKERLVQLSNDEFDLPNNDEEDRELRTLVMDIMEFNQLYKRPKMPKKRPSE